MVPASHCVPLYNRFEFYPVLEMMDQGNHINQVLQRQYSLISSIMGP